MLQASQFVPMSFDATVVGFGLTKSTGRLVARLLAKYGDLIDDEVGLGVPERKNSPMGSSQLLFRDLGSLTIQPSSVLFSGGFPDDSGPWQSWVPERLKWAAELLASTLEIQKQRAVALSFELTWLLVGESSTTRLIEYLGLTKSLNGFFAASRNFEIRGDTTTELPGLFTVDCELTAGRLIDYEDPENVGVQIKYWSPDNRFDNNGFVDYTRGTVDRFFTTAPQLMYRQLERYFPTGNTA